MCARTIFRINFNKEKKIKIIFVTKKWLIYVLLGLAH